MTMKRLLLATTLAITAIVPAQASDSSLSVAASSVVFFQYCKHEYLSMTPQQQDAITTLVYLVAAKNGKEIVMEAAVKEYANGYYSLGNKWCSIASSALTRLAP
jgi:hypothetical protein